MESHEKQCWRAQENCQSLKAASPGACIVHPDNQENKRVYQETSLAKHNWLPNHTLGNGRQYSGSGNCESYKGGSQKHCLGTRMVVTLRGYLRGNLRLACDDRYNKSFLHYFSNKRLNKGNGGLWMKGKDETVTAGNKYSRGTASCLCLSILQHNSPKHLCLEVGFKEK